MMSFGWDVPLVVDSQEVDLHPAARFDNPWVQADFGATRYEITEGDLSLILDFEGGTREASSG
jgi:hypothetical protein